MPDPMIILAGDIGGTHSRIAYFASEGGQLKCVAEETYPSADYTGLDAIVTKFVANHGAKSKRACFGVAGPVRNGQVKATNLPWTMDASRLAHRLAAREIRSGAALLKREADRQDAPNKSGLQAAALELDTLAAKVAKGQVSSPNELDQCFARADVALARNSHQLAEAAIAQGNHKQAGSWLEATSDYVEDAAGWSKQKLDTGESATLRGVHSLGRKIKDGTYWSADEVKKGADFLGGEIKKLGPGSLTQS